MAAAAAAANPAEPANANIPEKMSGLFLPEYSDDYKQGLEKVVLRQDLPVPKLTSKTQLLVRVQAAGVNLVDVKTLQGFAAIKVSAPLILGYDLAGVVVAAGEGVKKFKVGDAVMASHFFEGLGAYADYLSIEEKFLAKKPAALTFAEAAGVPMAALTSYQVLQRHNPAGKKVLVLGGSGGCGTFALQIAKHMGAAQVVTTCSGANVELCRALGADQVINYQEQKWVDVLKGQNFDLIYDTVGGEQAWIDSHAVLNGKTGRYATIVGDSPLPKITIGALLSRQLSNINRSFWSMFNNPAYDVELVVCDKGDDLQAISNLIDQGRVRVQIQRAFALNEFKECFELVHSGRVKGKVVFLVGDRPNDK